MLSSKAVCCLSLQTFGRRPTPMSKGLTLAVRFPHNIQTGQDCRFIHAREANSPSSIRRRKVDRPAEDIGSRLRSNYVLYPTKLKHDPGRGKKTSKQRAQIQEAQTQEELLFRLETFANQGIIDSSVFGAAMQRCGQGFWWDALVRVEALRKNMKFPLYPIERNIFLTALARCVRNPGENRDIEPDRQKQILSMAKEVWVEVEQPRDVDNFNIGLGAALTVCHVSNEPAGLQWADELWSWAQQQNFRIFPMQYRTMATALEEYGQHDRVDDMFQTNQDMMRSVVTLGALLNVAAKKKDLRRGEHIWNLLTKTCGVHPNDIATTARAKLYLLCGHLHTAVQVARNVKEPSIHTVKILLQALLVIYHSSLSNRDLQELTNMSKAAIPVVKVSRKQQADFDMLKHRVKALQLSPSSYDLKDILIFTYGKDSVMAQWRHCRAGSDYISSS
eukprot:TRINITY_DN37149_c0_g1_i1.p1 TRINITY_DN37149_c0_g1~~TRINITY_DN37149_c0_g1_i1.p1  ORF type:complete len:446 (+),score=19.79 TRINITY_DN37149_c0_g1_i1:175-1512(+)